MTELMYSPELIERIKHSEYSIFGYKVAVAQCPICLNTRVIQESYKDKYTFFCSGLRIRVFNKRGYQIRNRLMAERSHEEIEMNLFSNIKTEL